jgi:hypothetical protein
MKSKTVWVMSKCSTTGEPGGTNAVVAFTKESVAGREWKAAIAEARRQKADFTYRVDAVFLEDA